MTITYEELKELEPIMSKKESSKDRALDIDRMLCKTPMEWSQVKEALGTSGLYTPKDVIWALHVLTGKKYVERVVDGKTFIYRPDVLDSGSWKQHTESVKPREIAKTKS